MVLSSLPAVYSRWLSASAPLPALSSRWLFAIVPLPADTQQRRPGQQTFCHNASAGQLLRCNTSVSTSAVAPWPVNFSAAALRPVSSSASAPLPASNKPHSAEKSTPVWLAIWHTWAGFANSQLLRATFQSIYLYTCAHPHCCSLGSAAQTDANLSAHLHRLPTPPPYLRRMRLSPGRGRRCRVRIFLALSRSGGIGWQMI